MLYCMSNTSEDLGIVFDEHVKSEFVTKDDNNVERASIVCWLWFKGPKNADLRWVRSI
jgi:hypothetical protein